MSWPESTRNWPDNWQQPLLAYLTPMTTSLRPFYRNKRIGSIEALALALSVPKSTLLSVAEKSDKLYRIAAQELKSDGSLRQTFDAKPSLKAIQKKIKERLFANVFFPEYLQGSLKGRSPRLNAGAHINARIAISEDIQNFFPSVGRQSVCRMWTGLFDFPRDVAEILTSLTLKEGSVPQGAITSSDVANLVFWDYEPGLVERFLSQGLTYTRYVDDIVVSSAIFISKQTQSEIVAAIYSMLRHYSLLPKRSKHEVSTTAGRMTATKLVINNRVALVPELRQNIRAQVFSIERRIASGERGLEIGRLLLSAASRVGRLNSYHPSEGGRLKIRLKALRRIIELENLVASAPAAAGRSDMPIDVAPPWD